jgi:hypothetical protein
VEHVDMDAQIISIGVILEEVMALLINLVKNSVKLMLDK